MKNYVFMLCSAFVFLLASCGDSKSEKDTSEAEIKQEEKIADEVVKSSEKAKSDAEETEKEVDKLLEDI
jgi:Tfp pilus assembly protein PilO